jgi:hypothetical protein
MPDLEAMQRVRRLLEALPGVRVAWAQPAPGKARFGLAVSDPRTLARLVHLGCAVNMPLVAEVDWSCGHMYEHDDPGCIRYDLRVPVRPHESGDDDLTDLDIVEQVLTRELERLGLSAQDHKHAEPGAANRTSGEEAAGM